MKNNWLSTKIILPENNKNVITLDFYTTDYFVARYDEHSDSWYNLVGYPISVAWWQPLVSPTKRFGDYSPGIISCWKLTTREIIKLLFTRRVYVQIIDVEQPPILLSVDKKEVSIPQTEKYYKDNLTV